jgi:hypothetical protein
MEKELLKKSVDKKMTTRQMGYEFNLSQTTIRYWLKKYELKSKSREKTERVCPRCSKEKKLVEFYQRKGKAGASSYCKPCTNEQTAERQRGFKIIAVKYKGGCCEKCGYDKYCGALEFHHLDPKEKDFQLGGIKLLKLTDSVKKELDKCILVCSNCHREIHGGIID